MSEEHTPPVTEFFMGDHGYENCREYQADIEQLRKSHAALVEALKLGIEDDGNGHLPDQIATMIGGLIDAYKVNGAAKEVAESCILELRKFGIAARAALTSAGAGI